MRGNGPQYPRSVQVYFSRRVGFTTPNEPLLPLGPHQPFSGFLLGLLGYYSGPGDKSLPYFTLANNSLILLPTHHDKQHGSWILRGDMLYITPTYYCPCVMLHVLCSY